MSSVDFSFKLLILGDGGVGKTSFVNKYITNNFQEIYIETQAIDPQSAYEIISEKNIHFNIIDCGGQDRFELSRSMFYKGAHASLLFVDPTRKVTLDHILEWHENSNAASKDQYFYLILTKTDLEDFMEFDMNDVKNITESLEIQEYYAISSKQDGDLKQIFRDIGKDLIEKHSVNTN